MTLPPITRRRARRAGSYNGEVQHREHSEERVITTPEGQAADSNDHGTGTASRAGQFLTFRLDLDSRQRLRTRLAREGRSLSEVVIHGLRLYVQHNLSVPGWVAAADQGATTSCQDPRGTSGPAATAVASVAELALPDDTAVYLRDLRSSGQSDLLSAMLAKLHDAGWPLRPLAVALGISRQAVLARIQQQVPPDVRPRVPAIPSPAPFPRRRSALAGGRRPHLTVRIDHALRTAAHHEARSEGSSLSQVIEKILQLYLGHGLPQGEIHLGDTTPTRPATRRKFRIRQG